MRTRIHPVVLSSEIGEFGDEVRRAFLELGRAFGPDLLAGECSPPIDVFETDDTIEITVDLPGVASSAVRLMAKGDHVLIVGEKVPRRGHGESTFHLVERDYGRFARGVRLARPCDTARARATLLEGELRVSVPKVPDHRGRAIPIAIQSENQPS